MTKNSRRPFHDLELKSKNIHSKTYCDLTWINDCNFDEFRFSKEYRRSADLILNSLRTDVDVFHRDGLFMPVAYLYRHSMELALKRSVILGIKLGEINQSKDTDKCLGGHNLDSLWKVVCMIVNAFEHYKNNIANSQIKKVVSEYNKLDPSGQCLRYSNDKSGAIRTMDNYPHRIDLEYLKDFTSVALDGLEGLQYELETILDFKNEMESESR